jgi:type IV pilus assembly protein PilC
MATTSATRSKAAAQKDVTKTFVFAWEGMDKNNRQVRGEIRAATEAVVSNQLRRQGIKPGKIKKQTYGGGGSIKEKDIALFTRQLATMVRAGVPMLQSFDIAARSSSNPKLARLLFSIKADVEQGSSLNDAFRKHPKHFDDLYCNLVAAGEAAGILDAIMERLATYKEKIIAIKGKIKSALFYPTAVIAVAILVVVVIMWFVIPQFKNVFSSFGAALPWLTQVIIDASEFFTTYWWLILAILVGGPLTFLFFWRRVPAMAHQIDRLALKAPVFGVILQKAAIARWARTLSTMFAAGVPMVEALNTVAGAAGNYVYYEATKKIQTDVATGTGLTTAMAGAKVFPSMAMQMTQIGEETGALDDMLSKVADFYEREVDDAVAAMSSLIEPILIVFLGTVIGTIVVAMYLPIFKLGAVI